MNNLVEFKNISKTYFSLKKNKILRKINYKFKRGLIYCIKIFNVLN